MPQKKIKTEYLDTGFAIHPGGEPGDGSMDKLLKWFDTQTDGGNYVVEIYEKRTLKQNDIWHGIMREWNKVEAMKSGQYIDDEDELKTSFKAWANFGKWKMVRRKKSGLPMQMFFPRDTSKLSKRKMRELITVIKLKWLEEYEVIGFPRCKYIERDDVNEFLGIAA